MLHVIAPGDVGGAERVVHTLATGQHRAGHRVAVATVLGNGADRQLFLAPLDQAGVETMTLRISPRAYGRERAAIVELCRRLRPDVVHTHGYHVDVVDAGAARRAGVPTVTTVHGFTGGDFKNWIYERLQRRAFRRFDAVVAVSRPLARDLERTGVPSARLHIVPNAWPAHDPPPFGRNQAREQLEVPEGRFHVGWVGRLTREKGLDVLLAALRLLEDVPLVVSVVGDERPHASLLKRPALVLIKLAGKHTLLQSVVAVDLHHPDREVLTLRRIKVVAFEAMAAEAPIVATAVGGVPDVVTPREALLVAAEDPAGLAQAIRSVFTNPAAAGDRARRARARLASEFAPAPWLERYEAIYRSLG